ncbi:hypothetical protein ABPG74_005148 [Tetrahymena malaccensis]
MDQNQQEKTKNRAKQLDVKTVYEGKWIKMNLVDFQNEKGHICKAWEMVERQGVKPDQECNGVDVCPIIKYKDGRRKLLLIANYRPPVNAYTVEFPAGLLDDGDLIENARRELKEETGYTADEIKVLDFCPLLRTDPWKSNETTKVVIAYIDGDKECNINPKQDLETEENIDIFLVDLNEKFMENLRKVVEENNYQMTLQMYSLCLGFSLLGLSQ